MGLPEMLVWSFLFFCRIGSCLMVIPGYSSSRVPMKIRLFVAIAISLSLTPILLTTTKGVNPDESVLMLASLIISEILKGVVIGLMGRMFMLALQFAASGMAMFMGMGTMPGTPIEGAEPVPALVSLITLTATALIFFTDLHLEIIQALLASYEVSAVGDWPVFNQQLDEILTTLATAMFLAIQASAPFVIYSVMVNLAIGLTNKLTPQIPIYFISLPFVLMGGLFLLFFVSDEMLGLFISGFGDWVR